MSDGPTAGQGGVIERRQPDPRRRRQTPRPAPPPGGILQASGFLALGPQPAGLRAFRDRVAGRRVRRVTGGAIEVRGGLRFRHHLGSGSDSGAAKGGCGTVGGAGGCGALGTAGVPGMRMSERTSISVRCFACFSPSERRDGPTSTSSGPWSRRHRRSGTRAVRRPSRRCPGGGAHVTRDRRRLEAHPRLRGEDGVAADRLDVVGAGIGSPRTARSLLVEPSAERPEPGRPEGHLAGHAAAVDVHGVARVDADVARHRFEADPRPRLCRP